jgi:hypothetical protein
MFISCYVSPEKHFPGPPGYLCFRITLPCLFPEAVEPISPIGVISSIEVRAAFIASNPDVEEMVLNLMSGSLLSSFIAPIKTPK